MDPSMPCFPPRLQVLPRNLPIQSYVSQSVSRWLWNKKRSQDGRMSWLRLLYSDMIRDDDDWEWRLWRKAWIDDDQKSMLMWCGESRMEWTDGIGENGMLMMMVSEVLVFKIGNLHHEDHQNHNHDDNPFEAQNQKESAAVSATPVTQFSLSLLHSDYCSLPEIHSVVTHDHHHNPKK